MARCGGQLLVIYFNLHPSLTLLRSSFPLVITKGMCDCSWKETYRESYWVYHRSEWNVLWRVVGGVHNLCSLALVISYFLSNAAGFASSKRRYATKAAHFAYLWYYSVCFKTLSLT